MSSKIAIVCSEFYKELVMPLYQESSKELQSLLPKADLKTYWVSGSGEIPLCIKWLIHNNTYDGILALGIVIRGQTTHYDFICNFLNRALWDLQKESLLPIIFSVLTVENKSQAIKRIKEGRGKLSAKTLVQMMNLKGQIL